MDYDSATHETRTNAEHRETGDDFRVSYESLAKRGVMAPHLPIGSPERSAYFAELRLTFDEDWKAAGEAVRRERIEAMGDLYFVRCGNAVKIGHTTNIVSRLTNMQVNSPHEIDCLLLLKGRGHEEPEWHKRFKADRVRGEWFKLSAKLKRAIEDERDWRVGSPLYSE